MIWAIGGLAALLVLAAVALQIAIWRNGPAVLDLIDRISGGSRGTARLAEVSLGQSPNRKLIVHGPARGEGDAARPVLLFVHGGSWNKGNPEHYGFIGRAFVPEGFIVVLAGYRLHPEAVYPAMLEDTAAAIAWTRANIAQYGGDPDRLVLAGHSAGAYNVVMTALEARWLADEHGAFHPIAGVIGLAGPYDFHPFDNDSTRASFGHAPQPEATQPINHVRPDAPPKLLIHGEKDTLVKPRNSRELSSRLLATGARVETLFFADMDHNGPLLALASPWRRNRELIDAVTQFAHEAAASVPVQDKIG